MTTTSKTATYKLRYEPDDDGLRFQDLTYEGNFVGLEPVPDGILGDKIMRRRAKTGVVDRVSKDEVLRQQFTLDELNDLNNYLAWNIWDVLVMRATEGVSGMIPRQEYEILAFMHEFYRWPEILRMTTDEAGPQGVMDIGATARREIGTKVNCVHDWCIGAAGFGMGRCGLLALEAIQPDDYVEESNDILKFMQRVLWGKRQDGYILNSQDRYRCRVHEQEILDQLLGELEDFEPDEPKHDAFTRFNAAATLLAFLDHFDSRLGLGDTGPYLLPDGRVLIVRDLFTNEEEFHWSDVCDHEDVPHCYTAAVVIDAGAMGLAEIRVNDISTSFTRPKNPLAAGHSSPVSVARNSSSNFFCLELILVGVSTSIRATRSPRPRPLRTLIPAPRWRSCSPDWTPAGTLISTFCPSTPGSVIDPPRAAVVKLTGHSATNVVPSRE